MTKADLSEYIRIKTTLTNYDKKYGIKKWVCPRSENCDFCHIVCITNMQKRLIDIERKYDKGKSREHNPRLSPENKN